MHYDKNNIDSAEASIFVRLSHLKRRNVIVHGRRTSVTLEPRVWEILQDVAKSQELTVHELCSFIYDRKHKEASLASAIRVFLLSYLDIQLKRVKDDQAINRG